ncbi:zinc finger protein ZAT1 [Benincasa hispida]|uniref:zinc finger protein ZAT1 n=1 Tax=Benincasa hispida TaxID=102211 RepID=UPI0018FF36C5|nr:zinc finger protein ZAT1 [Benincasa hispida]
MDRHKCKLCFRSFSNGRALGGHMRSHMMNLPVPPKGEDAAAAAAAHGQLSEDGDSASFLSSPSSSEGDAEEKGASYGLRENPKRSIRVVDPEFSFAVDAGSVVLQDRESETESSKNPNRRRSKRTRKPDRRHHHHHQQLHNHYNVFKRLEEKKVRQPESWTEVEPVSSISGSTTEEDVAFWLMMLSRDKWTKQQGRYEEEEDDEEDEDEDEDDDEEEEEEEELEESMEETDDSEAMKFAKNNRNRGNYKCETCNKVFRSYQALGGHRASHKKIKVSVSYNNPQLGREHENAGTTKIHECPVCLRVFSSGQALGGHKRSHVTAYSIPPKTTLQKKFPDSLIDLNLPAPFEEDDVSQIELSAVSDADFVNAIRQ